MSAAIFQSIQFRVEIYWNIA